MTGTDLVIDVRNVTKRFDGKTVVDGLAMQVRKGEIYGFLGPNGSGKTTFIRMICGLLRADEGEGTCLGYDFRTQSDEIKRQVGYMTQKFSLYEDLSLEENLDFIANIYGMKNHKPAVAECLENLGLSDRKRQLAGQLSGGWKQRLALAACLLHRPRLLLLDEPTAGVDPKARREFWLEIHRLAHEGMTILVTTHYMDEAEQCDRLAYIAYGHLLANGMVKEVIASAGLTTYRVTGPRVEAGVDTLRAAPGVGQVVPFGRSLHVSGRDAAALQNTARQLSSPDRQWDRVEPGLEDVFIALMDTSKDNFRDD
ncbi:MAG: ABC transporter ATP-binding protein [Candidatus Methylacidiphilales bacterium]|nr:ABC transporter ATP-binding protein [Candidatus Methylacidiphilales bacterium]